MKKKLLLAITCSMLILVLGGYYSTKAAAPESKPGPAPAQTETAATAAAGSKKKVAITIDGKKLMAEIVDNTETRQLLDKLPMDLDMTKLGGANLIYGGRFKTAKGSYRKGMKKGELAFCHYNYFMVFYDDQPRSYDSEFLPIGKITSGEENLSSVVNGGKLHMELAK